MTNNSLKTGQNEPKARHKGVPGEPLPCKIKLPNLPFNFSECDASPSGPAPLLGQHNRETAASVGYSSSEIDTMVADGVLYAEAYAEKR